MSHLTDIHSYIRSHKRIRDVPVLPGKRYPRFPQVELPALTPINVPLTDALAQRRSTMRPMHHESLSLLTISQLLGHSMGIRADGQRPHPSGGARFPLEAYLFPFQVEGLRNYSYHYQPETHRLEELWELPQVLQPRDLVLDQSGHIEQASAVLILTAVWERSTSRYATFAFEPILMEAGHIGQNIALLATALNLTHRPFAGYKDVLIAELLDFDGKEEQVVYAFVLGS